MNKDLNAFFTTYDLLFKDLIMSKVIVNKLLPI
jgi:hypothetical protein